MAAQVSEWKDFQQDLFLCGEKEWETDYAGFHAWIGNPYWVRGRHGETLGLVRCYTTQPGCHRRWCACHPETSEIVFFFGKNRVGMHTRDAAVAYLCWAALME